jgi:hypothetical protein
MRAERVGEPANIAGQRLSDLTAAITLERMRQRKLIATTFAAGLAVFLLYALAAGPLVYLRQTGRPVMSDATFAWIYHPLIRAEDRIPPLGWAMHWYVGLWEPDPRHHTWQPFDHGFSPVSSHVSAKPRSPTVAPRPVTQQAPAAAPSRAA